MWVQLGERNKSWKSVGRSGTEKACYEGAIERLGLGRNIQHRNCIKWVFAMIKISM
jgi:hypothetical protein